MKPDVCYRCPSTESLDGALQTELGKSTSSLIPTEIQAEFVFTPISTITVPVTFQPALDALIEPADFPQSLAVEYALCRQLDGKARLQIQRVVAKSIVEAITETDGFKYSERRVHHPKEGGHGARFLYVCNDSTKNHRRKANEKKDKENDQGSEDNDHSTNKKQPLATYDCGGSISVGFSTKKDGVNVIYTHNPIHRDVESRTANASSETLAPVIDEVAAPQPPEPKPKKKRVRAPKSSDGIPRKRGRPRKVPVDDGGTNASNSADTGVSTSSKSAPRKRKAKVTSDLPETSKTSTEKARAPQAPPDGYEAAESSLSRLSKGGACNRCREKKIKCNGAKPTCNQCKRGLWTCH